MSDKKDDDDSDEDQSFNPNNISFDFTRLGIVNNAAIENMIRIRDVTVPGFLEQIRAANLALTPTLDTITEQVRATNSALTPTLDTITEQVRAANSALTPTLDTITEHVRNIHIIPEDLKLNIEEITPTLISTPELIPSFQKDSELIEKQNQTLNLLERIIETQDKQFKKQNVVLNVIFKIIKELKEEQRLEHPYVDKLYDMAIEWGLDPIDPENS